MLELRGVSYHVGKSKILREVSLHADKGEAVVLLGKNGSGKTTLLRAIGGHIASRGEILLDGEDVRTFSTSKRAMRIGCMPQVLPVPHVTVRELVLFGRSPYTGISGIAGKADNDAVDMAMETVQVTQYSDRYADTLSGGERQRCFFAMLLAQNTDVLLLDEPTANLDTEYRELMYRDIIALKRGGKTVIIVMHHLSEACTLADRVYVIHKGETAFSGTPDEFSESRVLSDVFRMKVYNCTDERGNVKRFFGAE